MKSFFKNVLSSLVGMVLAVIVITLLFIGIISLSISSVNNNDKVIVKKNSILEINLSDLADLATDDDGDMSDMESTETALGDLATDEEDEEEDELMEDDIVAQILSALNEDEAPKVKAEEMKVSDQHKMPEMETTEPIKKAQELEEERVEEEDSEVTDKEEDEKNENLNLANEFTKLQESINTLGQDNKVLKINKVIIKIKIDKKYL